jgi:hypothetical protein
VEIILQRGLENIRTPNLKSSPTTIRSSSPAISRVHPHRGSNPCAHLALLPSQQRKIERWHKSLKNDCIRQGLNLQDAHRRATGFLEHYNTVQLHSRSATSPQPTNSPVKRRPSLPLVTKSSFKPQKPAKPNATKTTPTH